MKLHYITIEVSNDFCIDKKYRMDFEYHTRFISNYLSRKIRKHKFETDGCFNGICISLGGNNPMVTITNKWLVIDLPCNDITRKFNNETERTEFFLGLFTEGFKKASEYRNIPLAKLNQLVDEFRVGGMKNEWIYKRKLFRDIDLKVTLKCFFTTNDFKLIAEFESITSKKLYCSSIAMRTMPDELCFNYLFRYIVNKKNILYITDFVGEYYVYYKIEDIIKGEDRVNYRGRDESVPDLDFYDMVMRTIKFDGVYV